MSEGLFARQIDTLQQQLSQSYKSLRAAPPLYQEILTDAFAQINTTLEELRVAEEELRQQNEALTEAALLFENEHERYRNLFNSAPSGYVVTDRNGLILEVNPAACILLNVTRRGLMHKSLLVFVSPDYSLELRSSLTDLVKSMDVPMREFLMHPRNGHPFIASVIMSARHSKLDTDDTVIQWTITDVSDLRRAERKIEAMSTDVERRANDFTQDIQTAVQRERYITRTIVGRVLQAVPEHAFAGLAVRSQYIPASHEMLVGGDFFDTFMISDNCIAFVVGDVSGKGPIAASYTAEVKYMLRAYLRHTSNLAQSVGSLNDYLCEIQEHVPSEEDIFVALSVLLIDSDRSSATVITAGMEPPLLLAGDSPFPAVHSHGLPLGIFHGSTYETFDFKMNAGDRIVMVTDGITEARTNGSLFGIDGLIEVVGETRLLSIGDAINNIVEAARSFAGGDLQDDACIVMIERNISTK